MTRDASTPLYASQPPAAVIRISRRKTTATLTVVTATLVAASAGVAFAVHEWDTPHLAAARLFDMNAEGNVPSWFSGALLMACAVAIGLIGANARVRAERDARRWGALAIFVAAASLDEVAGVHELIGLAIGGEDDKYLFLVPGSLLLLLVFGSTLGLARRLSSRVRTHLGVGAATWVFGAVILEVVEARSADVAELTAALLGTAQDAFELAGLTVVLNGLIHLSCVGEHVTVVTAK